MRPAEVVRAPACSRPTCRSRSSATCTTTTGPATASSPTREFWIQQDEVAFWTGRHASTPAFRGSANVRALAGLVTLNYANRLTIIEGDHDVLPGLRLHRVGGHTAGLQIVTREDRARSRSC